YALAAVTILGALGVIFSPKIIYSTVSLVVAFLSTAGIFILLNADFVGLAQILIYGVGITIILVFAIMLTSQEEDKALWIAFKPRTLLGAGFVGLLFLLIAFFTTGGFFLFTQIIPIIPPQKHAESLVILHQTIGTAPAIGENLLKKYLLPFEVLSILLLAAIIGAAVLANKDNASMLNPVVNETEEEQKNECDFQCNS
ncbi:MAG: NADH-quinone oxidoreductase subunit J, partial [Candidatus Gastranaerophilaceae bacterium]